MFRQGREVPNGGKIMQPPRQLDNLRVSPKGLCQSRGVLDHDRQMLIKEGWSKCVPAAFAFVEYTFSCRFRNHSASLAEAFIALRPTNDTKMLETGGLKTADVSG